MNVYFLAFTPAECVTEWRILKLLNLRVCIQVCIVYSVIWEMRERERQQARPQKNYVCVGAMHACVQTLKKLQTAWWWKQGVKVIKIKKVKTLVRVCVNRGVRVGVWRMKWKKVFDFFFAWKIKSATKIHLSRWRREENLYVPPAPCLVMAW